MWKGHLPDIYKKAYGFDIDSNLFFTNTMVLIDIFENGKRTTIEISQKDYDRLNSQIKEGKKYRYVNNDPEQSMVNFRGSGFKGAIFDALDNNRIGPSYYKYVEAHRRAAPRSDITARGHPREELKDTNKEIIIYKFTKDIRKDLLKSMQKRLKYSDIDRNLLKDTDFLIETYLNNNYYAPCSNEEYLKTIGMTLKDSMSDRKNAAFEHSVLSAKKVFEGYYGSDFFTKEEIFMGFSDDTKSNIDGLHKHIYTKDTGLMRKYPEVKFRIYDTGEPMMPVKISYKNN